VDNGLPDKRAQVPWRDDVSIEHPPPRAAQALLVRKDGRAPQQRPSRESAHAVVVSIKRTGRVSWSAAEMYDQPAGVRRMDLVD
jgi:hypothetical protein